MTVNLDINLQNICNNGGIQTISMVSNGDYLLGPCSDTFNLSELVKNQVKEYN